MIVCSFPGKRIDLTASHPEVISQFALLMANAGFLIRRRFAAKGQSQPGIFPAPDGYHVWQAFMYP
jgi:hypothetical protein